MATQPCKIHCPSVEEAAPPLDFIANLRRMHRATGPSGFFLISCGRCYMPLYWFSVFKPDQDCSLLSEPCLFVPCSVAPHRCPRPRHLVLSLLSESEASECAPVYRFITQECYTQHFYPSRLEVGRVLGHAGEEASPGSSVDVESKPKSRSEAKVNVKEVENDEWGARRLK